MAKKINFKYYFTLCFITSYIIFITILTLKAIPNKNSNNDLEELLKRDDISYDLNDIYNSEEKSKYYKPDDYGKNIVNGQFAFIHIIWASIASGFRAMYSISKNDLIRISESDFKNPSGIVQTALNTKGLVLLFVVLALFAVFALLLNIVCFPLYICINICTKTRYTTKNYKKSKILCGRIFFGIFSFLLTFSPLFALMGYQSISNSVDTITKGSKTLIYDIDEFVINAEDVIKNKATNIVIDTVRAEVVDPIKYEIDIKIIQNATVMYDKALDTINEVIPFINEVKNIVYEDGYPVINKLYNLIQELEVDYNQDLSKLETDVFEKNTTLNDVLNTLNEFESVMSDTKQTLDDNNIHEIYNKALNTIDDAFKMVDEFTSEFTNIDLSDIRTILHDDVYNTINDIEGYKSDIDIFSPNLFYKTLFLIITLLSVIVILFAILRLHKGVKTLLITCIPIGAIFWIITIIFLLISVLVSQTCNTIYELDSETVATIYKKVETIYGNIEQKENDEILNSLSNYNFKFETFSKLIYSCASDKNNDTSIWSVLEKEEFNSLIKTTCSIIEENIQLEEIKIECSEVNGRDDLIKSFVKAINITGKISEEVDKIDISEILSGITDIPEIPTEIEIPEISIESLKSSLNEITSNIDTICLEEKKIYYNSQVEDINNRVNKLDQKLQSKKDDMENKLIPNIEVSDIFIFISYMSFV
ncbi:hypothetical protein BCR36DRAFT_303120 [Piromyces finnis]|uniref:Uncharacterized protein n=1 Tax=Piromyces finnis TaxID=1754191 RepID=A0A1Y1UYV1_9FUNG|nr:hypothetical protein BCR36DRAFT_303120 [Piromyces finnis]|eukprot:ORX43743.1 hypothetical protein BCR36DRAFT_303120 [Piromyces finnis]